MYLQQFPLNYTLPAYHIFKSTEIKASLLNGSHLPQVYALSKPWEVWAEGATQGIISQN